MPTDTSYLFFQRERQSGDEGKDHHGPTIKTPRVITTRTRSGSVPPMHFGSRTTRAASVQPMTTSSSVRLRPVAASHTIASGTRSGLTVTDVGKDGHIIVRRVISPSSTAEAAAVSRSTASYRSSTPAPGRSAPNLYRRASISGPTAGAAATLYGDRNRLYSSTTPTGGLTTKRSSIYFPSSQASYGRSPASVTIGRRASISGASPSASTTLRYPPALSRFHTTINTTTKFPVEKTVDNNHPKWKPDFEKQLDLTLPWQKESLSNLRARTQVARDQLSRHRVLLDRYLPLNLGPTDDVSYEVECKYGELLSRMPHLEQRERRHERENESIFKIEPYKPASTKRTPSFSLAKISVCNSFTPKVSETRKRARSVLCKVKGDPNYFNYQ